MKATRFPVAPFVHSFLSDFVICQQGMSINTIRSYRDVLRKLLLFAAASQKVRCTQLEVHQIGASLVLEFLSHLEKELANSIATRNHRLAVIRSFFEYVGTREMQLLDHCRQVTAIPMKRCHPSPTRYLERDEVETLLAQFKNCAGDRLRHYALILFLYNTGARAQEAVDLRFAHLDLEPPYRARIRGKGAKWRVCPLWEATVQAIRRSFEDRAEIKPEDHVFVNRRKKPLTRFGIYYLVRQYGIRVEANLPSVKQKGISPHILRHSTAVHLLEAGVEVNVIRGWLGHSRLETTNRYAEINFRTKERALQACAIDPSTNGESLRASRWNKDGDLLRWLQSL